MSFQRRMAEKATADVLAILEDNGATDISETLDSNSDHETAKVEDGPVRGDANSSSIGRRNEHEEYSGSDTSPMLGGSLSWKGRNDRPHIREKYKKFSIRSQSNITSIGSSSPKHQLGRSCRQIKRRDTRYAQAVYFCPPFMNFLLNWIIRKTLGYSSRRLIGILE